jgi:hypothetical protein
MLKVIIILDSENFIRAGNGIPDVVRQGIP